MTNNVKWTRSSCRMRRTDYCQRLRQVLEPRPIRKKTERRLRCVKIFEVLSGLEVNQGITLQLNLDRPSVQIIPISFHSRICIDAISPDMQTASSTKKNISFSLNSYRLYGKRSFLSNRYGGLVHQTKAVGAYEGGPLASFLHKL